MQPLYIACRLAAPCGVADYIKGDVLCSDMEKADWIAPIGFKMSLYCTEIALIDVYKRQAEDVRRVHALFHQDGVLLCGKHGPTALWQLLHGPDGHRGTGNQAL